MNAEEDPDAQDVRRVVAGETAAFEGIVRRWQKPLLDLAWRSCRRRDLAEDLAQEAFVKIFRALPGWRAESSFSTWIFAIALNHYRARLRRTPLQLLGLEAAGALVDPATAGEEEGEATVAVQRAVAGLPRRYREPIVLHYFLGQDVRHAAAILGIAEGTLKARLARARSLLARSLGAPRSERPPAGEIQHG